MNRSLKASSRWPSASRASASVMPRGRRLVLEHARARPPAASARSERQQHAVEPLGVGVDADDRLRRRRTSRRSRPGRPARARTIRSLGANTKVGTKPRSTCCTLAARGRDSRRSRVERAVVGVVLAHVVAEVAAGVLDVELRLAARVEPLDQLREPRLARDEDDLLVHRRVTAPRPLLAPISDFSRSGVTLSSPIFDAFSASSRNASAIISRGSPPPALRSP